MDKVKVSMLRRVANAAFYGAWLGVGNFLASPHWEHAAMVFAIVSCVAFAVSFLRY